MSRTRLVVVVATAAAIGLLLQGLFWRALVHHAVEGPADASSDSAAAEPSPAAMAPHRVAWRWSPPPSGNVGMPAADERGVVFAFSFTTLVALAPDGAEQWRTSAHFVRDVAPALDGAAVYVALDGGVAALDRATGATLWVAEGVGERPSTPVVSGGTVVAATWDGELVGLATTNGAERWRVPLGGPAHGPPAVHHTTVVATADAGLAPDGGRVAAVDVRSGEVLWHQVVWGGALSGPTTLAAGSGGTAVAVVVAGDQSAHAFDLARGGRRWTAAVGSSGAPEVPPFPIGDDLVAVAGRRGHRALLRAHDGHEVWRAGPDGVVIHGGPVATASWLALALDDGTVVVGGPGRPGRATPTPARVTALALLPRPRSDPLVLVAGREAPQNHLWALEVRPG